MPTGTVAAVVEAVVAHTAKDDEAITATLLDTVGVVLAASEAPSVVAVRCWLEGRSGPAPLWGAGRSTAPADAALLNGTAAHALDFDDAGLTMPIHPSAVLWPTLLALATPATPVSELTASLEAGQVLFRAIPDLLPMQEHYDRGWHATATVGRLAATAAAARLGGLTADQAAHALGIASSTAAGSLANFGTMTKPLHAGLAARDAVTAVGLAAHGLTANPDELDHPLGFLARYGSPPPDADLAARWDHWVDRWRADWVPKQWPSCFGTHRAIAATLRLVRAGLAADEVAGVRIAIHPQTMRPLLQETPTTGDQAKFNLPFCIARTLLTGGLGLADFTDALTRDPATVDLASRIAVAAGDDTPQRYADLTVTTCDGRSLHQRVTLEEPGDGATLADVEEKFVRTVAVRGDQRDAVRLRERLTASLQHETAGELLAAVGEEF